MSEVIRALREAGIYAREEKPDRGVRDERVFQMDIAHRNDSKRQYFQVWPGEGTVVRVLDTDLVNEQALLLVSEPERWFERNVSRESPATTDLKKLAEHGSAKLVAQGRYKTDTWFVRSNPEVRRFLMGMDETHYFIARVPRGDTVKKAKDHLRPQGVPRSAKRTGEWFLLPTSKTLATRLDGEAPIRNFPIMTSLAYGQFLERRGRPFSRSVFGEGAHFVDEIVFIDNQVFIRGKIRQPRHRVVKLNKWHEVVRNLEIESGNGIAWVD